VSQATLDSPRPHFEKRNDHDTLLANEVAPLIHIDDLAVGLTLRRRAILLERLDRALRGGRAEPAEQPKRNSHPVPFHAF
jgi:hypothetical protein